MKNSDMKVIAIILSIALVFTILTSNAVSIASVILLANGGAGFAQAADGEGDSSNGGSTANVPSSNSGSSSSGSSSSGSSSSGSSSSGSSSSGSSSSGSSSSGSSSSGSQNSGTSNSGSTDTPAAGQSDIEKDPLGAYQKAAKAITDTGAAGYDKKAWQSIEGDGLQLSASNPVVNAILGALKGTLTNLITGFMTSEADASVDTSAKGSDDAKNRMPLSNCSAGACKATAAKDGNNYVVTIVMNDQINPAKSDTDGLRVMSKDILYMEDVVDTIQNDETVSAIVKELKRGEINYKAYTIKATMTADGKFISIDHDCVADLTADIVVGQGDVSGSGQLGFHTRYTNFQY